MIEPIIDAFKGEDVWIQYTVLGYRIDLYFYENKLAIEIDELGHNDRNTDYQIKRQREIEKELNCVFIRTIPDAADFNINKLNNQIFKHIIQAKEEKLKNNSTKELLTYVSSIFIPLKPIKYFVNKYFPHCNHEKHTIKNKANKNWKTIWNKVLFRTQKLYLKF